MKRKARLKPIRIPQDGGQEKVDPSDLSCLSSRDCEFFVPVTWLPHMSLTEDGEEP